MSGVAVELKDFLLPKLDDPLQVGFLIIISAMILCTIASVHWMARPASWEKKWRRGASDRGAGDVDIENGSVTDLSNVVATSPEKLAEIMPGMLLVVGLLGTFLGLGMALNHASAILSQSNAIADSMGDLLGLLQGLGTKFKTSTWGIMGFVLLKIWSEVTRVDERRLTWVIAKVKAELDRRDRERKGIEEARIKELFRQVSLTSEHIVAGICAAISQVDRNQLHLLTEIRDTLIQAHGESQVAVSQSHDRVLQGLDAVRGVFAKGLDRLDQTLLRTHSEMENLLRPSMAEVHETLVSIQEVQKSSNKALTGFTKGTKEIVQEMADAAKTMAGGASNVSSAANGLEVVVSDFGSEFKSVLDNVRRDLGNAIGVMSERSSVTLKEGADKLEGATKDISKALGNLSRSVTNTMGQVKISIEEALEIQKKSSMEFTTSAELLNSNIVETTLNAKRLGENIKEGLASVANAGQQMRSIGKNLEKQVPILEKIVNRDDSDLLFAILREIEAIGAKRNALESPTQDGIQKKLHASEGESP